MSEVNSNYNYSYTIIKSTLKTINTALLGIDEALIALTSALENKQDTLVSGENIKTINNASLLGEGNIEVQKPLIAGENITIAPDGQTINANPIVKLYLHRIKFSGRDGNLTEYGGDSYIMVLTDNNRAITRTEFFMDGSYRCIIGVMLSDTNLGEIYLSNVNWLEAGQVGYTLKCKPSTGAATVELSNPDINDWTDYVSTDNA